MKDIALIGAGGHAKVIIEIIEAATECGIVSISDTNAGITTLLNHPVSIAMPSAEHPVIIAIGSNAVRKKIASSIANGFAKAAVHPRANVSTSCTIGDATVVMAGASINASAVIGAHCIINTNASVDHDCTIGDYVHVAPGVSIAGGVEIGEGTLVGIGSCVIPGIRIGKWATIGAGSVIISDVPDHAVVVGVPGDIIKYNQ